MDYGGDQRVSAESCSRLSGDYVGDLGSRMLKELRNLAPPQRCANRYNPRNEIRPV